MIYEQLRSNKITLLVNFFTSHYVLKSCLPNSYILNLEGKVGPKMHEIELSFVKMNLFLCILGPTLP